MIMWAGRAKSSKILAVFIVLAGASRRDFRDEEF
jgi:hypothetical protein